MTDSPPRITTCTSRDILERVVGRKHDRCSVVGTRRRGKDLFLECSCEESHIITPVDAKAAGWSTDEIYDRLSKLNRIAIGSGVDRKRPPG